MASFWRDGADICAVLDEAEAQLVRRLVTDVQAMLTEGAPVETLEDVAAGFVSPSPAATPPQDPAIARLLPDGYRDDPEAAAELRQLIEPSLRQAKSDSAQRLLDSLPIALSDGGGVVTLDETAAEAWLHALNDVRLVLGTRLGVSEELEENEANGLLDGDDPGAVAYQVYCWLGVFQEELLVAISYADPEPS